MSEHEKCGKKLFENWQRQKYQNSTRKAFDKKMSDRRRKGVGRRRNMIVNCHCSVTLNDLDQWNH